MRTLPGVPVLLTPRRGFRTVASCPEIALPIVVLSDLSEIPLSIHPLSNGKLKSAFAKMFPVVS